VCLFVLQELETVFVHVRAHLVHHLSSSNASAALEDDALMCKALAAWLSACIAFDARRGLLNASSAPAVADETVAGVGAAGPLQPLVSDALDWVTATLLPRVLYNNEATEVDATTAATGNKSMRLFSVVMAMVGDVFYMDLQTTCLCDATLHWLRALLEQANAQPVAFFQQSLGLLGTLGRLAALLVLMKQQQQSSSTPSLSVEPLALALLELFLVCVDCAVDVDNHEAYSTCSGAVNALLSAEQFPSLMDAALLRLLREMQREAGGDEVGHLLPVDLLQTSSALFLYSILKGEQDPENAENKVVQALQARSFEVLDAWTKTSSAGSASNNAAEVVAPSVTAGISADIVTKLRQDLQPEVRASTSNLKNSNSNSSNVRRTSLGSNGGSASKSAQKLSAATATAAAGAVSGELSPMMEV
jgi:hypothetical protein